MIVLRRRAPTDDAFIFSSWLHSFHSAMGLHETAERLRLKRSEIQQLLAGGRTLVAHSGDDESTILGWACASGDVLDYVYVREAVRKEGICRALCDSLFAHGPFEANNPTPRFKLIAKRIGCRIAGTEEAA